MKKIIILILLVPNVVLGETIYTEYEPFILNTNEYLEETDTLKREEISLYNIYKEEIEERYLSLDDPQSNTYNIEYNDYIYEYKNSLVNNQYSYDFQTKCLNESYTPKSLTISNFNESFKITEVQASSNKLKGVGIGITNFKGFMSFIANGIINESPIELNKDSTISLNLYNNTEIDDLQLKLYLPKQELTKISFTITSKEGIELTNEIDLINNQDNIITITFDNNYYNFLDENNFNTSNNCISYYSLKIPLYKHTKLINIPLNNYIPLNNNDLFIIDDYKTNYNYYKREKIVLLDEFTLTEKRFELKDSIKSTTIPLEELKVIDKINYEKDGEYLIDIYYQNNLLVTKTVKYIKNSSQNVMQKTENTSKESKPNNSRINKTTKKVTTRKTNQTKYVTTNYVKFVNNQVVANVKDNKYQDSIIITIVSALLVILILFECILLYVKKKYY